jgi:hypothetical protein
MGRVLEGSKVLFLNSRYYLFGVEDKEDSNKL